MDDEEEGDFYRLVMIDLLHTDGSTIRMLSLEDEEGDCWIGNIDGDDYWASSEQVLWKEYLKQ